MALTTKDEEPASVKAQRVVVSAKSVTEDDVKALYQQGKNLYDISREVFGFDSEEALERVRRILGIMEAPETRIIED